MALKYWFPMTDGTIKNNGTNGDQFTSNAFSLQTNGKLGKCIKTLSTSSISGGTTAQDWVSARGVSFAGWFYFPESEIKSVVNASSSSNTAPTGTLIGYNSYGGAALSWTANKPYVNGGFWVYGTIRTSDGGLQVGGGSITSYLDKWVHLATTIDFVNKKIQFYINGSPINAGTSCNAHNFTPQPIAMNASQIYGGNGPGLSIPYYCNDVRVYDEPISPREVAELAKGLVLHYPLGDSYLEGTTNLYATLDGVTTSCYNGATGKYGYGANTDIYKTTGTFNGKNSLKIYMGTSGASARPYVYFGNLFTSNGTNAPEYKTLSFDYYGTIGTYINFYKLGSGSGTGTWRNVTTSSTGTFTNSGNVTVAPNQWNHIELVLHGTTDANAEWGYGVLGDTHTSNTANYWLFANVQLETKDHATGFANYGTTRAGGEVYDTSGFGNNGTANNSPIISSDAPRYNMSLVLDGVNQSVQMPNLSTLVPDGIFTANIWFKKVTDGWGSKAYETIFGGPSGFELEGKNSSTNSPVIRAYNWGGATFEYTLDVWHMLTMVRTTSDTKFYLDGELKLTGSAGSIPSGNYFLGAWSSTTGQNYKGWLSDFRLYETALTADQVKQLYEAPISLADNGTLFANEFNET